VVAPVASSYSVAAGQPIYAGRLRSGFVAGAVLAAVVAAGALSAPVSAFGAGAGLRATVAGGGLDSPVLDIIRAPADGLSNLTAVIGDSLTEHAFRSTPFYWQNGLLGAPLDIIANSGYSGQSIIGLQGQIAENYKTGSPPGLAGLPALGFVFVRIGTNNYRGSGSLSSIDNTTQAQYLDIIAQLKTYAEHVVCTPIPPIVGITNEDQPRKVWNAFCRSAVLADTSGRVSWLDDCVDLESGGGGIAAFFNGDGYHMNGAGARQMGLTMQPKLEALLANQGFARAPLVQDPADVYPAQPQWIINPTGAGNVSFSGGWSGNLPTDWSISTNGSGIGGTTAIVAADAEDPNQVPWVRITPTTQSSFAQIRVQFNADGRTITSSDPSELEQLLEVRFNGMTRFNQLEYWISNNSGVKFAQTAYLKWGETIGTFEQVVMRQRYYRDSTTAGGAPPRGIVYIYSVVAGSGDVGYVDIRCPSVRG